ncbi:hypothetical protein ACWEFJ_07660 [Actinosynnema sp. NPDC004786]
MTSTTTSRTGRALGAALALAVALGALVGLAPDDRAGADGATATPVPVAAKEPLRRVKASAKIDQTHWERVPGLGGATCVKTRIQGTIAYEYVWAPPLRPRPDKPAKTYPSLNRTTIVSPQVTVSAWSRCSGSGRKAVKLSGASFEQRWLNGNQCSASGLSLSVGGPPWAAYVGTTINCGESSVLGRKSDFAKVDNDFRESNSNVRIDVHGSALKRKGSPDTGEWYCARVEVGGRVTKSNRNDNFAHTFYPCLRLPAGRNP